MLPERSYDPIWIYGQFHVEESESEWGSASFTMKAVKTEDWKPEDMDIIREKLDSEGEG